MQKLREPGWAQRLLRHSAPAFLLFAFTFIILLKAEDSIPDHIFFDNLRYSSLPPEWSLTSACSTLTDPFFFLALGLNGLNHILGGNLMVCCPLWKVTACSFSDCFRFLVPNRSEPTIANHLLIHTTWRWSHRSSLDARRLVLRADQSFAC